MKKETIHEGFPSEVSPASMELIEYLISNHFFTNHIYLLDETKEHFIYSKHNSNENENEVEYVALSKNELETFVRKYSSDSVKKVVLRSEEHTSELQSRGHLVCRLLLEKKKISQ